MLTIDDKSLLTEFERNESEQPSPKKIIDKDRTIYGSRKLGLPKDSLWGHPVLCDFGEARIGLRHKGTIQPVPYRAPEVLFDMGWTTSVDIWNVAVLVGSSIFSQVLLKRVITYVLCRYGTISRTGTCSMPQMKTTSHQRRTTSLK
jgi:hypothetical protein